MKAVVQVTAVQAAYSRQPSALSPDTLDSNVLLFI